MFGEALFLISLILVTPKASRHLVLTAVMIIYMIGAIPLAYSYGLGLDVLYTWVRNKAGLDILKIQLIDGWVLVAAILISLIPLLSDPRVSLDIGEDGVKRLYIHSKFLSLVRLIGYWGEWDTLEGDSADHMIRGKIKVSNGIVKYVDRHFNDKVRLFPKGVAWKTAEFLLMLLFSYVLIDDVRMIVLKTMSLKYSSTNLLTAYLDILGRRLSFSYQTPVDLPIKYSPLYDALWVVLRIFQIVAVIWILRLIISIGGDLIARDEEVLRKIGVKLLAIFSLLLLPTFLWAPLWVYTAKTPYSFYALLMLITLAVASSLSTKIIKKKRLTAVLLSAMIIFPAIFYVTGEISVEPYMQGRMYEYAWIPAYMPTIRYTQWAYNLNNMTRVDMSFISSNSSEVLSHIRVFTGEAARRAIKPFVGVNWMSAENTDPDIIYYNGREYWSLILTLVRPPYSGDVDVWRAEHLILTHSERIFVIDASNGSISPIEKLLRLNKTPTIYYGEGGLWSSVDEVYLIPTFKEMHLSKYVGPERYTGDPDYIYRGFWRWYKFIGMWRWDFAEGDYGDIKTLTYRDTKKRVSSLLLPGLSMDPDGYLVTDGSNLYLAYLIWIYWNSPSPFLDWPEHDFQHIIRRFAVVLVNLENGRITGYLTGGQKTYIEKLYRSLYPQWNKKMPDWLSKQLRYSERFFKLQIFTYNWYWQTDFFKWQSNIFYEPTMDEAGNIIEDVRYILVPIRGELRWVASYLAEWYKSPSRNLAGMYIALGNGTTYFVDYGNKTVIGPWQALSAISNNPDTKTQLTLHPNWFRGNILLYVINGKLYYVVPYYAVEQNLILPVMLVLVDAETQELGYYVINDPRNPAEVQRAPLIAYNNIKGGVRIVNIETLIKMFEDSGIEVLHPTQINPDVSFLEGRAVLGNATKLIQSFIERWKPYVQRVFMWSGDNRVFFGVLVNREGIVELHYIEITLGG